ncbi:hypothetical protein B0T26DRAFT_677280 [Lasiosphaeria miniovina]|uniref:Uncharacterized protein n=1 Tax=Lasiosphaeria miniovina TaxID=1954250 RepID=A0AA40ABJ2_9PEZI|nr:uncharacterized protein B0T26DRAFT_677280 [Lasiosphaeria miniovina]KAK0712872.1 hypothetical protein B0T26DRAFT_677280 [Lasiosphaeria miniovina]
MAAPIPVASFGNNSKVAQDIRARLLPEYDLAHICLDLETAQAELPLICAGNLETEPSSGLGSNAGVPATERKVPRAIIFGGGIPTDEIQRVHDAVQAKAPEVKQIHLTRQDILDAGATGPDPEVIGRLLRQKLAELVDQSDSDS